MASCMRRGRKRKAQTTNMFKQKVKIPKSRIFKIPKTLHEKSPKSMAYHTAQLKRLGTMPKVLTKPKK